MNLKPWVKLLALCVFTIMLGLLSGCGGGGGGGGTSPPPSNQTAEKVASATVGSSGYTFNISSADANLNNLSLAIPAGALSGNANITISKSTNCPSSVTEKANSYCLALEPSGLVFNKPVKLTIPYTISSDIQDLVLVTYNESMSKWEKVNIDSIDTTNKTITASITHFSIWTLMSNLINNIDSGNYFDSTLYKNTATGGIAAKSIFKGTLANTYLNWRSNNNTALMELLNGYAYSSHSPYYVYRMTLYKKGIFTDSELSTVRFYVYPIVYYGGGASYKFAIVDDSGKTSFSDESTSANADPWYQNKNFVWDFMCSGQPCKPDEKDTEYFVRTKLVIVDGKDCADSLIAGAYCNSSVVDGAVVSYTFTNRYDTIFKAPLATLTTATYSISGQVTFNGVGLADVTVSTTGKSEKTDSNGNYTISGLNSGNYTMTAAKDGYTFSNLPPFAVSNANVTGNNFTATAAPYSISGRVTFNGSGLSGVTIKAEGDLYGQVFYATTDSSGNYIISTVAGSRDLSYLVTASKTGYNMSVSQSVRVTVNDTGKDFTATLMPTTFSIFGQVTQNGAALSGVTVTLSGSGSNSTTTDASGNYTFTVTQNGTYTVTAFKTGYVMSAAQTVTINNSDATGTNFTASNTGTIKVGW